MKLLIVGRTGTGKDTLCSFLQKYHGWTSVLSATTRARRPGEDDTHVFMSKDEAAAIPDRDKVARTFIRNESGEENEYFATRKQIEEADCYIIDPKGVYELLKNMPEEVFEICYLKAPSKEKQKEMAILRANGDPKADVTFENRYGSEDGQFTEFENKLDTFSTDNCYVVMTFENDYDEDSLRDYAFKLDCRKRLHERMQCIISHLKTTNSFHLDDDGNVLVCMKPDGEHKDIYYKPFSDKHFVQLVLADPEGFLICMENWLGDPNAEMRPCEPRKRPERFSLEDYVSNAMTFGTFDERLRNSGISKAEAVQKVCDHLVDDERFIDFIDAYVTETIDEIS